MNEKIGNDYREYFQALRNHSYICKLCGDGTTARVSHLRDKHHFSGNLSGNFAGTRRVPREVWIKVYESIPHRVDLEVRQ